MRLVAGGGAVTELLLAGRCGEGAERPGALWQRSIGKKLLAWGAAKCGKEGGALRGGPCAWKPVLGNLRVGPCAGKQGRTGRRWSLPQPVARILLCGALPEFKVKNLLLQCTYNGAGRDFFSHFNRNPA